MSSIQRAGRRPINNTWPLICQHASPTINTLSDKKGSTQIYFSFVTFQPRVSLCSNPDCYTHTMLHGSLRYLYFMHSLIYERPGHGTIQHVELDNGYID